MADFNMLGSWDFFQLSSSGLANVGTAYTAYYNPTTKLFSYDLAPSGTFNPAAPQTITGDWTFSAGFGINAPNIVTVVATGAGNYLNFQSTDDNVFINAPAAGMQIQLVSDGMTFTSNFDAVFQSTLGNLTIQASTGGRQVNIYSDAFDFTAQGVVTLQSATSNVAINANSGAANMHGATASFSADTNLGLFTTNGNLGISTANGDLNLTCGTGPSSGNMGLNCQQGNINLSAPGAGANGGFSVANSLSLVAGTGDANLNTQTGNVNIFSQSGNVNLNVNTNPGSISMNAQGGNWGVSEGGVSGGTSGGAGANITADGDFSFGSGAPAPHGTFLFGSLTNTVQILSHLGMSLINDTNDSTFQATAGFANIMGGAGIKLLIPTLPVANNTPLLMDTDGSIHV